MQTLRSATPMCTALVLALSAAGCNHDPMPFDETDARADHAMPATDAAPALDATSVRDAIASGDTTPSTDATVEDDATPGRDVAVATDAARDVSPGDDVQDSGTLATDAGSHADGGIRLRNLTDTSSMYCNQAIWADVDESGDRALVRLTPPSYPFTVTRVHYYSVAVGAPCDPRLAHHVELFVTTATTPPASPTIARRMAVPATTGSVTSTRDISVDVDPPLQLESGEQLYVAIEMLSTSGSATCLSTCTAGHVDRNFWSVSPTAPFGWESLADWGETRDPWVEAWGSTP